MSVTEAWAASAAAQSPVATRPLCHTQTASVPTREAAVGPNASSGLAVRHSTNVPPAPGVDGSIQEGTVKVTVTCVTRIEGAGGG